MVRTALRFILYDKAKSIGVVVGIVISIFLIGQQVGTLTFLMRLMGGLVDNSNKELGHIWVVDNITNNANELTKLDESLVREFRSIKGVENTFPVVVASAMVKFPNGKSSPVLLVGSEAPTFIAGPKKEKILAGNLLDLAEDAAVSGDFFDQGTFDNSLDIGKRLEINGKEAFIRLQTRDARGFAGSFFYTTLSRARFYGNFPDNKVSAIAVQVKPGHSISAVAKEINQTFYGVRAWKTEDLQSETIRFITISSNIGTSVGSLVLFAIISGFFIISLTLFSSTLDHLRDYGTLKAIGATNAYVRNLILMQSFIFAIAGYVIALILIFLFKAAVTGAGLIIQYSVMELVILFLITVFISVGGSLVFSIRKINNVEPASVFRG
jgi:putative ABC transport system permease protein